MNSLFVIFKMSISRWIGSISLADLIIDLKESTQITQINRLEGIYGEKIFFSQSIPVITLPVKAGRDLAALVETAVLNQGLRNNGYYAEHEFTQKKDADLQWTSLLLQVALVREKVAVFIYWKIWAIIVLIIYPSAYLAFCHNI